MNKPRDPRTGNRTAAALATLLTVIGHVFLGFEQPWSHVVVALSTGYACAIGFEAVDAYANGRPPGYAGGGWKKSLISLCLHTCQRSLPPF